MAISVMSWKVRNGNYIAGIQIGWHQRRQKVLLAVEPISFANM